jgi:hypothetical protein
MDSLPRRQYLSCVTLQIRFAHRFDGLPRRRRPAKVGSTYTQLQVAIMLSNRLVSSSQGAEEYNPCSATATLIVISRRD